jgi:hypothetical protein
MKYSVWFAFWAVVCPVLLMCWPVAFGADEVVIRPREYPGALRNPLKGFRPDTNPRAFKHEYATITRCYLKWNDLENDESDGIDRIREVCNDRWKDVEKHNIKVIPRVYLDWNKKTGNEYYRASGTFDLAVEVGPGHYILALAILDPAGMKPAVRFAIENYFTGGYHPVGMVGVGEMSSNPGLSADDFDNTAWDRTLRYELR